MKTSRRQFLGTMSAGSIALGLQAVEDNYPLTKDLYGTNQANKKAVILLAHPNFNDSKANKALVESVKGLSGITVLNLYDEPFNIETYKKYLSEAGIVIFQFPFYWASTPSRLKKWCDEIFTGLTELVKGKQLMVSTTTGSEYEAYRSGGRNQFTMDELLRPYQLLANHSGMIWQTPFIIYGVSLPTAIQSIANGVTAYKQRISNLLK